MSFPPHNSLIISLYPKLRIRTLGLWLMRYTGIVLSKWSPRDLIKTVLLVVMQASVGYCVL